MKEDNKSAKETIEQKKNHITNHKEFQISIAHFLY
jgi:hypothetical protein